MSAFFKALNCDVFSAYFVLLLSQSIVDKVHSVDRDVMVL